MRGKFILIISAIVVIAFGFSDKFFFNCKPDTNMTKLTVTSKAFNDTTFVPTQYTCDAENVSPPLSWTKGSDSTKTYALICDDPDATSKVWVHWVLFNIPSTVTDLPENIPAEKTVLQGAMQGTNDMGDIGYSGPCPPGGTHHYYFKVYAPDCELSLTAGATKSEVEKAINDNVLSEGVLIGKYKRK
jgi:Raf kinase inhibitor-like YbhB/YbcL family protein